MAVDIDRGEGTISNLADLRARLERGERLSADAVAELMREYQQAVADGPVDVTDAAALDPTPMMEWLREHAGLVGRFYQAMSLRVPDGISPEIVTASLQALIDCHDMLRLTVGDGDAGGWQLTVAARGAIDARDVFRIVDLGDVDDHTWREAVLTHSAAAVDRLAPRSGVMLQALLVDAGPRRERYLVLLVHHLSIDGVSWRIVKSDLENAWSDLAAGRPVSLEAPGTPFREWTRLLKSDAESRRSEEIDYWTAVVSNPAPLQAGLRADPLRDRLGDARQMAVALPSDVMQRLLNAVTAKYHVGIQDILLGALVLAAAEWRRRRGHSTSQALLVDVESHGRHEEQFPPVDLSRAVGWFTSIYPVRLDAGAAAFSDAWHGGASLDVALKAVKEQLRGVPSSGIGYGLLRYLNSETKQILEPYEAPQIGFNYLGRLGSAAPPSGEQILGGGLDPAMPVFHCIDINSAAIDSGDGARLISQWTWAPRLLDEASVQELADAWCHFLRMFAERSAAENAGGRTPSDVPLANVTQADIERIEQTCANAQDILPLTPLQEGLFFHALLQDGHTPSYLVQFVVDLTGPVDHARLRDAFDATLRRHDSLRVAMAWEGLSKPVQVVWPEVRTPWEALDLSGCTDADADSRVAAWLIADRSRPIDLRHAPLMRVALLRRSDARHQLVMTFHHLLMDGWSMPIFLKELFSLYSDETRLGLPPSYRDYVAWLAAQDRDAARSAWQAELAGFTPTLISGTHARAAGGAIEQVTCTAPIAALVERARAEGVTLNALVEAAWSLQLARIVGTDDVVFGVTVATRPTEVRGSESMVGLLVNMVPKRVRLAATSSVAQLLQQSFASQARLLPYQYLGLTDIQRAIGAQDLFDTAFVFENYPVGQSSRDREGALYARVAAANDPTHYPLCVSCVAEASQLQFRFDYRTSVFDGARVREIANQLVQLLEAVGKSSSMTLSELLGGAVMRAQGERESEAVLPLPQLETSAGFDPMPGSAAVVSPAVEMLCTIFADVLGVERIEPDDDFIALGGDSLLAVQLIIRIRAALDVDVPVRTLFDAPTPNSLGQLIHQLERPRPVLTPRTGTAPLPLSYGQWRLWVLDRLGSTTAYNAPQALRLRGTLDVAALAQALATIVARHESLRTRFAVIDGEPCQVVDAPAPVPVPVDDLRALAPAAQRAAVTAALRRDWEEPFDLATGPLLRVRLLRVGDAEHVLLRTVHHVVTDGWSEAVFNRELLQLYDAYHAGQPNPLPPLAVQYADFALWQRHWLESGALADGLRYWTAQLAGAPERLALPTDRPRPVEQTFGAALHQVVLPPAQVAALKALGRAQQTTMYMTLLAGFSVLLARYSGEDDIVVGSPIANRQDVQLEGLIGFFVNSLVLRVRVQPAATFTELLAQVRRTTLEAYRHQDVPFEKVVEALAPARHLSTTPLYQVVFAMQNAPWVAPRLTGLAVEPALGEELKVRFDLEVYAREEPNGLHIGWMYNRELFDQDRIARMSQEFCELLATLAASPTQRLGMISGVRQSEQRALVQAWSPVDAAPAPTPVVSQFEEQVRRSPTAPAVTSYFGSDHEPLTYDELNARANRLAHVLIAQKIGPGDFVGIGLAPSVDMLVALLAVLKAGAAYVPIDTSNPVRRLRLMLENIKPRLILSISARARHIGDFETLLLDSQAMTSRLMSAPATNPVDADRTRALHAEDLAYAIHTSGSTGAPKGVGISHRALAAYLAWAAECYRHSTGLGAPLSTAFAFDASVTSLYVPLLTGSQVILLSEERPVEALAGLIGGGVELTFVKLTPTHLQAMADLLGETGIAACKARQFVVGGESLSANLAERWQRAGLSIVNEYGPTEATVGCAIYEFNATDGGANVPIGTAVTSTRLYVLDSTLSLTPIGVPGELYISGEQLARAYINQPALTAGRFVADPYGPPGSRMYRTGDLVVRRADGILDLIGRADSQVKIHGFRIELGEIESVLRSVPLVRDAAVIVRTDQPQPRLVAYVLSDSPASAGQHSDTLRRTLQDALPDYMVPAAFVVLERWPLTSNGKLDRATLPAPEVAAIDRGVHEPRTPEEYVLCRLFAEILGVPKVYADANFVSMGGDSIMAIQLVAKARAAGIRLTPRDVFQHRTVEALAAIARPPAPTAEPHDDGALSGFEQVLPLRTGGQLPPLFCLPPAVGVGWSYTKLLDVVDSDRPIYCLQAAGIGDGSPFPADVEAFADYYLAAMRAVQPEGPYFLLGWSFGGLVAHAMAVSLQRMGQSVALLAMIDAYPESPDQPSAGARVDNEVVKEYARQRLKWKRADGIRDIEQERMAELVLHVSVISHRFTPGLFTGDLVMFGASDAAGRSGSWMPHVSGRIITHPLPYTHRETSQKLPVAAIGRLLQDHLNSTLTGQPQGR